MTDLISRIKRILAVKKHARSKKSKEDVPDESLDYVIKNGHKIPLPKWKFIIIDENYNLIFADSYEDLFKKCNIDDMVDLDIHFKWSILNEMHILIHKDRMFDTGELRSMKEIACQVIRDVSEKNGYISLVSDYYQDKKGHILINAKLIGDRVDTTQPKEGTEITII